MEGTIKIPLLDPAKFSDIITITETAAQITEAASAAGMFLSQPTQPMLLSKVRTAARQWIALTESRLKSLSPGDALKAAGAYDLVHRIAFNRPADPGIINKYTLAAFAALLDGDKTVDEYILFRQINEGIKRRDPAYAGKPVQWHSISLARWHADFAGGRRSSGLSDYDTMQRVDILLQSDLWAFETTDETAYKQRLTNLLTHTA